MHKQGYAVFWNTLTLTLTTTTIHMQCYHWSKLHNCIMGEETFSTLSTKQKASPSWGNTQTSTCHESIDLHNSASIPIRLGLIGSLDEAEF